MGKLRQTGLQLRELPKSSLYYISVQHTVAGGLQRVTESPGDGKGVSEGVLFELSPEKPVAVCQLGNNDSS